MVTFSACWPWVRHLPMRPSGRRRWLGLDGKAHICQSADRSRAPHDAGFEFHPPEVTYARFEVVAVARILNEANSSHFRACSDRATPTTSDSHRLHDNYGIAVNEFVSDGVAHHVFLPFTLGAGVLRFLRRPLVGAHRTREERSSFIGVLAIALRAGRESLIIVRHASIIARASQRLESVEFCACPLQSVSLHAVLLTYGGRCNEFSLRM